MKAQKFIALGMVLMIVFCGCSNQKAKSVKCEDFFKDLKNYEATATVTFLKDHQENTIQMKQLAKMEGSYEMTYLSPKHLEGTMLKFDGEKIIETYPDMKEQVEEKAGVAENEILVTSFTKRMLSNGHAEKQKVTLNGKKAITYELPIEGNYKYLAKEKIWVDEEKMIPIQLEIYDNEGNVSLHIQYEDFKYNS